MKIYLTAILPLITGIVCGFLNGTDAEDGIAGRKLSVPA